MNEYELKHWKRLTKNSKSIELANADCYASLSCRISPDGKLALKTNSGASHGEPSITDEGRTFDDWINLLTEAKAVYEFYYRKSP